LRGPASPTSVLGPVPLDLGLAHPPVSAMLDGLEGAASDRSTEVVGSNAEKGSSFDQCHGASPRTRPAEMLTSTRLGDALPGDPAVVLIRLARPADVA